MRDKATKETARFMEEIRRNNPGESEFHQAVEEFAESVMPFLLEHPEYRDAHILERMAEPERSIIFRVTWEDDRGKFNVNRGWRVQFNSAIGPYKGGLRFHPSVNHSVLKFLGFEQTFKNSLTGLPMGGGKGGANFDPKGKSDREVLRFCQAFMTELFRHIGADRDVPAGDIGVGGREIGYLFGQYKRLANEHTGVLTGKGLAYGGSLIRPEATGYGCVYFCENMFNHEGDSLAGKTCTVSGSGNVAIYTVEKALELGAKVLTLSDSSGFIHDPDGLNPEKLAFVKNLKEVRRGRIAEYAEKYPQASFHPDKRPWCVPCDVAFPSATQNEISGEDAAILLKNGVKAVSEGANMPTDLDGVHQFLHAKIFYGPAKAANAGGVAVSGLEQSQNAMRLSWSRNEVDAKLQKIMLDIHNKCVMHGAGTNGHVNYVQGANVAGFIKVANAMLAYGCV
ncbi:MAG: NADP-specific glutamate dehydrogenase [Candidatus Hydrogenedentes bacterium]|nr:NADP-specific glutamate dehydrogenase [Candidatus Hydrogenedentota bacterium]